MPVMQRQHNHSFFQQHEQHVYVKNDYPYVKIQLQPKPEKTFNKFPIETDNKLPIETDHDFSLEGKQVSEAEYWEKYYTDTPYEWNNGVLEVKPMSDFRANLLSLWFKNLLMEYRNVQNNFQEITLEIGFQMRLKTGKKIRKPDIGFVGPDSLQMKEHECTYPGIFDLCVEFLSDSRPSEVRRDTKEKLREYEEAGVKEYFILDRNEAHTAFYRLKNKKYEKLDPPDGVIQSEVLKGFQLRIDHLYSRPDFDDLMHDPVYQHYVKLDKQQLAAEKKKLAAEKKRADEQMKIAEAENKRAELYRQKLAELGINL